MIQIGQAILRIYKIYLNLILNAQYGGKTLTTLVTLVTLATLVTLRMFDTGPNLSEIVYLKIFSLACSG